MKNLLLTALLSAGIFASAFAIDESKISLIVRETFKEEFKETQNVEWSIKPSCVKASFTYKGEAMDAFYDFSGKKIGASHHVTMLDVPLSSRKKIEAKYPSHRVTEAIEFIGQDENSYYISLENEKETVIVKINDHSTMSLFKKSSKTKFW